MRIYEGSPRQDWEEVLRSIGSYADHELLKEVLLLELDGGFVLQALALPPGGTWSESAQLQKRTVELDDDAVGNLIDEAEKRRGTAAESHPEVDVANYYEQALRVLGKWVDGQRPRDLFLFEQGGSFVLRMLVSTQSGGSAHQLAEFTREEILAMIEAGPQERGTASEEPAPERGEAQ